MKKKTKETIINVVAVLLLVGAAAGIINSLNDVDNNTKPSSSGVDNSTRLEFEDLDFTGSSYFNGKHTNQESYPDEYVSNLTASDKFKASNDGFVTLNCTDSAVTYSFEQNFLTSDYVTSNYYNVKIRFAFTTNTMFSLDDLGINDYSEFTPGVYKSHYTAGLKFNYFGKTVSNPDFNLDSADALKSFYWFECDLGNFQNDECFGLSILNDYFSLALDCLIFTPVDNLDVKAAVLRETDEDTELSYLNDEDPYKDWFWGKLD